MHARISFLVIFYRSIQDFKTNEPLSKKNISFLFLLKSREMQIQHFVLWQTISVLEEGNDWLKLKIPV